MEYTRGQQAAITAISNWIDSSGFLFKLSGLSGTGKTFVLSELYNKYNRTSNMVFVTPTGRAAANLSMRGVPALTVHAFIYDLDMTSREKLTFTLKEKIPENVSVIVVDEASMLTAEMFKDILSFGAKVLVCGDPGQLPAIGADSKCLKNPDIMLTEIVRQSKGNPIVTLANAVYQGEKLKFGVYGDKVAICGKDRITLRNILSSDQVIVATNKERMRINKLVRDHYKRYDPLPVPGDKLVCTRNQWSSSVGGVPIINGMLGYCEKIRMRSVDTALIQFRPEHTNESVVLEMDCLPFIGRQRKGINDYAQFEFGYAITLHKAQGSEWDKVLVIRDMVLPNIAERSWLYTAMTRAKQKLILGV